VAFFVARNGKRDPSVDLRMTRNIVDLTVNEQAAKTFKHSKKVFLRIYGNKRKLTEFQDTAGETDR
jgi:hypothetical protein